MAPTALAGLLLTAIMPAGSVWGQQVEQVDEVELAEGPLDAPLADVSTGRRAHGLVEQWVRDVAVPTADAEGLPEVSVTGVFGVRVTLRLDGLTISEGDAYRPANEVLADQPGSAVDLVTLLRPATRAALDGAHDRLAQAHFRAAMEQVEEIESPEAPDLSSIANQLLVDVQIGHSVERIQIGASAEREAVFSRFAPGYHGLRSPGAGGQAEGGAAVIWPATAIARHMMPGAQVMQLLDAHGRDPQAIVEIGRPNGLALQRFEVLHFVRPQRHMPVMHLVRGNVVLPHSINSRTLNGMTARMADHLQGRFTSEHIVRGTYRPTSDRYDPQIAEARAAALASYALMRHARHRSTVAGAADSAVRALADTARHGSAEITRMLLDQPRPSNPGTTALVLLTFVDDVQPGEEAELRDRLTDQLLALHDVEEAEQDGFATRSTEGEIEPATPAARALATAALAAVYQQTRDDRLAPVVQQAIQRLWAEHERNPDIATLPWLAMAHQRAAGLLASDDESRAQLAEREQAMGMMIEQLIDQQVVGRLAVGPADVVGGFELDSGPANAPPSPDWRTAQLLSFLALSLGEDRVLGDRSEREIQGWTLSAGLAARFIAQLMMDEASSYYVRSLDEAVGGVRMTLWDNHLPVAPTAMSLLACVQLQETLEKLSEQ